MQSQSLLTTIVGSLTKKSKNWFWYNFHDSQKTKNCKIQINLLIKPLVLNGVFMKNVGFFWGFGNNWDHWFDVLKIPKNLELSFLCKFKLVVELHEMPGIKDFLTLNWDLTRTVPSLRKGVVTTDPFNTQWSCSGCQLDLLVKNLGSMVLCPY
jgi:hypothetical protein